MREPCGPGFAGKSFLNLRRNPSTSTHHLLAQSSASAPPTMTLLPEQVPPAIREMHNAYERLTGAQLTLNWPRLDQWRVFLSYRNPPFSTDDLRIVVAHIRKGVSEQRRNMGALKFHNLIGQPDYFEEDLNEARALSRPKPSATKTVAYNATQRIVPNDNMGNTAVPMADVIKAMREAVEAQP